MRASGITRRPHRCIGSCSKDVTWRTTVSSVTCIASWRGISAMPRGSTGRASTTIRRGAVRRDETGSACPRRSDAAGPGHPAHRRSPGDVGGGGLAPGRSSGGGRAGGGVMIDIVSDSGALGALKGRWNALAERFETPLLGYDWFEACVAAFCPPDGARIVVLRDGKRVRAIAPLSR